MQRVQRHMQKQHTTKNPRSYIFSRATQFISQYFSGYFTAERKTSLGKDWHSACLRCEKCKKTLAPGSHAEV